MPLKIRLLRIGAKKKPFYRVVVAESGKPRDGRFVECLGTYNPLKSPAVISIEADKARRWLKQGATPSLTVKQLFKEAGVFEADESSIWSDESSAAKGS